MPGSASVIRAVTSSPFPRGRVQVHEDDVGPVPSGARPVLRRGWGVPIDVSTVHAAPPDRVHAVLTEESFLRETTAALGAQAQEVTADDTRTRVRMLAPTAGIPAVFARFVPRELAVTDTRTWRRDGDGWSCDLEVRAEVFGRSVEVTGERRLAAGDGGTRSVVTAEARVDAPLVGRQAEGAVRQLVEVVLRREGELLDARLTGG